MLLFPCNQFLSQEPSKPTKQLVKQLSKGVLDLDSMEHVKMMGMVDVNGEKASSVFSFLKYNSKLYDEKTGLAAPLPWNFCKFLVNPAGGGVYGYYEPSVGYDKIISAIECLLAGGEEQSVPRKANSSPGS
mmetsp:Transcript_23698/g.74556  ORF Transcript_23698/g.74556 Transcript_23698/m.74556 type:complete len:131 (+) Transcript_23698:304-696(+)